MDLVRQTVFQLENAHSQMKQKFVTPILHVLVHMNNNVCILIHSVDMRRKLQCYEGSWRLVVEVGTSPRMGTRTRTYRNLHHRQSGLAPATFLGRLCHKELGAGLASLLHHLTLSNNNLLHIKSPLLISLRFPNRLHKVHPNNSKALSTTTSKVDLEQ